MNIPTSMAVLGKLRRSEWGCKGHWGCMGYVYTQKNTHEDLLGRVLAAEVERKAHKIALISI